MLADAFRAEGMRFLRQRGAILWGYGFMPALGLVISIATAFFVRTHIHTKMPGATLVGDSILHQIQGASSPPNQFFVLLAAAALFAGDYRWESWRLFTPRNSRMNLLLGKLGIYALASAGGLLLLSLAGLLQSVLGAAIDGSNLAFPPLGGPFLGRLGLGLATGWLDLMLLGELALLTAVLTRSNIAAVMVPFALFCVQAIAMSLLPGTTRIDPPLKYLLALPSLSVDMLRGTPAPFGEHGANPLVAAVIVAGWLAAMLALALWLFQRQDLTRE